MALGNAENVIVGMGSLWVAPDTADDPTIPADADDDITFGTGWVNVGYTQDGATVNYEPQVQEIFVDQQRPPVQRFLTNENFSVQTNMAEPTLENLAKAICAGTYTSTSATSQKLGIGGGELTSCKVCLTGPGINGGKCVILIHKAQAAENTSLQYKKDAAVIIPITFKALVDDTQTAGEQLAIIHQLLPGGN